MKAIFSVYALPVAILICVSQVSMAESVADTCSMHILPGVQLKKNSVFLSNAGKLTLDKIIVEANNYPSCKIKVCGNGPASEEGYQIAWDRTESVIRYMVSKGVGNGRIIFNIDDRRGVNGDDVILILTGPSEDGPSTLRPFFPCLSYHKLTPRRCKHLH